MICLGLDIGTSSISAVVMEDDRLLAVKSAANDAWLPGKAWERIQDPSRIWKTVIALAEDLLNRFPNVERIGVTGQQHGIVYLDCEGRPLSPLYTWQDGRGELPLDGVPCRERLSELTGCPLATGYGAVTHYYQVRTNAVPADAVCFCTIHDWVAMKLAGRSTPLLDSSDAASFGLFDLERNAFNTAAFAKAGMDPAILPSLAEHTLLGTGDCGIPVYTAIGDNQASFLGAVREDGPSILLNVGTGSQFSIHVSKPIPDCTLERRPFPTGGLLLVGAGLCGGRAYAMLEQLFRKTTEMVTGADPGCCYGAMSRLLMQSPRPEHSLSIRPLFQGTRADPSLRGSIGQIGTDNFTPAALCWGMLEGMTDELYTMYLDCHGAGEGLPLYGSGNGLRKNPQLCQLVEERFGRKLQLSSLPEEAACGAAVWAARQ